MTIPPMRPPTVSIRHRRKSDSSPKPPPRKPPKPGKSGKGRGSRKSQSRGFLIPIVLVLLALVVIGLTVFFGAYFYFSSKLDEKMSGRTWDLPSRLEPTVLTFEPNHRLPPGPLDRTLDAMGYLKVKSGSKPGDFKPGDYRTLGSGHYIIMPKPGWPGLENMPARPIDLQVKEGVVSSLKELKGQALAKASLPPVPFAEIRAEDQGSRRVIKLKEMPAELPNAVIAIEDRRFRSHFGIDPKGLARALFVNVVRKGRSQGGSTLTQQLAKNHFLTQEKTFSRKFKEIFYALALERKYSKDQILEMYLNEIYLGQRGAVSINGMEQAAYAFFNKDVRQLTLAEAATLAGMIQSPNNYAPDRHKDRARARRDIVLGKMLEEGSISKARYDAAIKEPVKTNPGRYMGRTAPYFVDYVTEQISSRFPDTSFNAEGYVLETTLDMRVQDAAEKALSSQLAKLDHATKAPLEGAVVALQPSTGRILAMVGGRNYGQSQFNRVTQAKRQPGSVCKPLVLLAAIQAKGTDLGPTTVLHDEPITLKLGGKDWTPQNSDKQYHGDVFLRQVLEQSLNVPTVRLSQEVGMDRVVDLYKALKISHNLKPLPSLALGAFDVSPLEVATAFTVLATPGVLHTPYAIQRVVDREGNAVYSGGSQEQRIVTASQAYMVRDMMRGVLERGTAKAARTMGYSFEAAGKTGTTNDFKDAWFVGFDADLLVVVWVGSDQPIATGFTGGKAALPVWVDIMKSVRQTTPPPADPMPSGISEMQVCAESREKPSDYCTTTVRELFWAGREPTEICHIHAGLLEQVGNGLGRLPGILKDLFQSNQD